MAQFDIYISVLRSEDVLTIKHRSRYRQYKITRQPSEAFKRIGRNIRLMSCEKNHKNATGNKAV